MSQEFDIVIVGAGIIGLTTAWTAKKTFPEKSILLLEKEQEIAKHQTGRNSGVIHSGIYYKPGSAKALNCQRGYKWLLEFCQSRQIAHDVCGKVIVATEESELETLQNIFSRGQQNGLSKIREITASELNEYEPNCAGLRAIHVPQAGIVDYKDVCRVLKREAEDLGVQVECTQEVLDIRPERQGFIVCSQKEWRGKFLFTTAGLYSDRIAKKIKPDLDFKVVPFRGEYYELVDERAHLVKNLIYPVPNPAFPFLGVHFTRMIKGGIEAGPNAVLAMAREGYTWGHWNLYDLFESLTWPGFQKIAAKHYSVGLGELYRSFSKAAFTKALQRLLPELKAADLVPAQSGVRAQACNRDGLVDDFWVEEGKNHILVLNAPSPAATSSFSVAQSIVDKYASQIGSSRQKRHEIDHSNL